MVPGDDTEQPRHDLKRPWDAVTKRADIIGVRLHDPEAHLRELRRRWRAGITPRILGVKTRRNILREVFFTTAVLALALGQLPAIWSIGVI